MDRLGKAVILLAKEVYQTEGYKALIEWLQQFNGRDDVKWEIEECVHINSENEAWWGDWEEQDERVFKGTILENFGWMNIKCHENGSTQFRRLKINNEKFIQAIDAQEKEYKSEESKK